MRICAHFSSACQVLGEGGILAEYLEKRLVFVFHYWGGGVGARWSPTGSSYPLDLDVYGELPSAAEHTAFKEAFFPIQE